ncbi:BREX-1 system phosphatase PglZ type A [Butyrivibrio fibrisolvens]|uniref:BREX-1 system phosphatase PglZ type A n=1 Tax=Butyrivibrio fibrisolvens TaxID=831 RepID=UPI0003B7621D|nr:BREX-1 system phosphatase PglZ type A [Butyrivibrio fibrisolvens]
MDLQEIQDKLNILLEGAERKIVFWYDDDAAYAEEINQLELAGDSRVIKLTGSNNFSTKLLLEHQDLTTNYLVYAPFARPEDKENTLVDIFYYSEHFYSDKLIQLMGELNIPPEYQNEVKLYKKFWAGNNLQKFKGLEIETYTNESIDLGILCVLAGVKTLSFEEMLRKTILAGLNDNSIMKKLETQKIDRVFWRFCEKQYGYKDSNPTIQKFLVTMLVTYMDAQMNGNEPKTWKNFVSGKKNDAVVFIKNLMNNEESKEFYDGFASKAADELNVAGLITQIPLADVVSSDALKEFDDNIIDWIAAKLEDQMLDEKISGMTIPEICETRSKSGYHFSSVYREKYQMLIAAYHVLKEVSLHRYQSTIKEAVEDYVGGTYLIDTYYRKFYYYLDRIGMDTNIEKIRDLVENMYTNKYLTDFANKWNQSLTDEEYDAYTETRQEEFFSHFVRPFMSESGGGRVVVIISDGMRYECARELLDNLDLDEKCDAKIDHMLSVLPSETTLGMASLLPNKAIKVDGNLDIFVDDLHCGNSTAERQKILQTVVPKSACYEFDSVMQAKQAEIREMFQDKDLVYIYQNQIDQRGEGMRSDNEVFNACQEAIEEIQTMIRRLTGYISNTRYLITADHGFIYKRDKLPESDKIKMEKITASFKNKRYLLSDDPILNDALVSRCMAYLSKLNTIFVTTPIGADIIKMPGGGQNYVHGGSSLQEMVVPVIKVNTFKGKQDTGLVNVELSSFHHRVTNIEVKLDFMQMEAVTDTVKPRRLQAFFVDADGAKISFPVPITANIKSADAKDRLIQEKFTLKSGRYSRDQEYFLVIADQDNEKKELHRYKFEIDISDM